MQFFSALGMWFSGNVAIAGVYFYDVWECGLTAIQSDPEDGQRSEKHVIIRL
jgi:hypothetical protein